MPRRKILLGVAVVLLLGALAAATMVLWIRGSGLPQRQGEVRIPSASRPVLSEAVEVRWDRWGVPHVTAGRGEDLAAALGWLHANDRLTQMELGRRAAAGRLSEIFGERTVELDRRFRTLRFAVAAEHLWQVAGEESHALLTAYAAGVNAWLEARGSDLPPTLRILGVEPEPWRPQDSLAFQMLMANDLSFWQGRPEEVRFRWLHAFGPRLTRDLMRDPDLVIPVQLIELAAEMARPTAAEGAAQSRETARHNALQVAGLLPQARSCRAGSDGELAGSPGSNNWALGGSRTASGVPLVANDPHLPLRLPGVWYQVLLRSPDYEVAGMSLPGLPGVVIGRNRHLAWAFTNTMLDDHDLFFERLDPTGTRVQRGGAWVSISETVEVIRVKNGEDVELTLSSTDRGPLLPADREAGLPPRSLAWTLYENGDSLAAFLALGRAHRVEEIPAAIAGHAGPAQNLVAADDAGGLLFTVLGRVPDRLSGDGRMASPGWDPAYGWRGLRLQETNPTVLRPASDLLVTANADIVPEGYPLTFAADFDTPHRAERIRELLSGRQGWAADNIPAVQMDVVSLYARQIVDALPRDRFTGPAAEVLHRLDGWDGTMKGSKAALYAVVARELGRAIFGDEAELHDLPSLASRKRLLAAVRGEMDPVWFDDVTTPEPESRHATLTRGLTAAFTEARSRWGEDPAGWGWEGIHPLLLAHPLGPMPLAGRWFDRGPFPMPGSATTVDAYGHAWRGGAARITYGPSMRWVADLADPDRGLAVLPGGQSGHPADPHYDDQLPLYLEGRMRPVAWSEEAIERATVARLTLRP